MVSEPLYLWILTLRLLKGAAETGADRIELYTEAFALAYEKGNLKGVEPYRQGGKTGCLRLRNGGKCRA